MISPVIAAKVTALFSMRTREFACSVCRHQLWDFILSRWPWFY